MTQPLFPIKSAFEDPRFDSAAYRIVHRAGKLLMGWTGTSPLAQSTQFHLPCFAISYGALVAYIMVRPERLEVWAYVGAGLWGAACYCMLWFPHVVVLRFRRIGNGLDLMFPSGLSANHLAFAKKLEFGWRQWPPLIAGVLLAGLAVITARFFGYNPETGTPISVLLTIQVGFLVGHSLYYIIIIAAFIRSLGYESGLEYSWIAPLSTPGLAAVSDTLRLMAQLGLLLATSVAGALVTEFFSGPVNMPLWAITLALATGVGAIILHGVAAQHWLAHGAASERAVNIEQMLKEIDVAKAAAGPVDVASGDALDRLRTISSLYQALSSSPKSLTDVGLITSYATTGVGVALPLIIAWLLTR